MIDTVIVSGGDIRKDFALDFLRKVINQQGRDKVLLIAADKGLEFFMQTGIHPDLAVGDFDSLSQKGKLYLEEEKNLEVKRLKPEKDDTDTQSALHCAAEKGAKEVVLLGATGSRLDHVLGNIGLLSYGRELGMEVSIVDPCNELKLIEQNTKLKKSEQFGKYVSFFSIGAPVTELTLQGFKYPLKNHCLRPSDSGLTVSNEIVQEEAMVTWESGTLLMIMSRD